MAKKKQQKRNRRLIHFSLKFKDDRVPKLLGLLLIIAAVYLLLAFLSYLYTWQADQNYVMRDSIALLWNTDVEVHNLLGRLGALVSHQFFYMWIGLPSFVVVILLFLTGRALLLGYALDALGKWYSNGALAAFWGSIFLGFLMDASGFPYAGTFGTSINVWLQSVVGVFGTFMLLLASIIGGFIWFVNPNFEEWKKGSLVYALRELVHQYLPSSVHPWFSFLKTDYQPSAPEVVPEKAAKPSPKAAGQDSPKGKKNMPPPVLPSEEVEDSSSSTVTQGEIEFEDVTLSSAPAPNDGASNELEVVVPKGDGATSGEDGTFSPATMGMQEENKRHVEPYDPTLELASYQHPKLDLLEEYEMHLEIDRADLEHHKNQIIETLLNYKIEITKIKATVGPTVTLYEIIPAPGVRISKIKNLEDDIALSLSALGIRIIAPIPGHGTVGIEVPNRKTRMVGLREILASDRFRNAKMDLPIALGRTISNEVFVADLAKMPHLLIAGATGQGKSVGINTILMSLLYKKHPSQLKMILVDPKKVELSLYSKLESHFLSYVPEFESIVTETSEVTATLNSICIEMDNRYDLLKRAYVRNIKEYNQKFVQRRLNPEKGHQFLPYIVLVIDEFADLIMTAGKEIELPIGRLAQLARAVGIHLIIATQRPSVNIITGVIKANFPARIAFKVSSKIDSRTILDTGGAEQLIGKGDMLLSADGSMLRLQCAFVDTVEVERVIDYIAEQRGYPEPFWLPEYNTEEGSGERTALNYSEFDENFEDAARLVVRNQQGSTSMIQRKLKLGYNRAGRIMDQLEQVGIVGPNEGSKAREVLIYEEEELDKYLAHLRNN